MIPKIKMNGKPLEEKMCVKALIIVALSLTAICSASMHHEEKYVNKSVHVHLDDVDFRANGMFLMKDHFNVVRLTKLSSEGTDYYAFYRIDYVCGDCHRMYREHPGVCDCGSTDIREREIDLWPTG